MSSRSTSDYAVIVCDGEVHLGDAELRALAGAGMIIGADGGALKAHRAGFPPNVVVGDLDSLGEEGLALLPSSVEVRRSPCEKDETDSELALRFAAERGYGRVVILGALGGRIDHALANLLLLVQAHSVGIEATVVSGLQQVRLLTGAGSGGAGIAAKCEIEGNPGDLVSLIPLGPVMGVVTRGLKYPLAVEDLTAGTTRGISNVILDGKASVGCVSGQMLVTWTRTFVAETCVSGSLSPQVRGY